MTHSDDTTHTCHEHCQRTACLMRRKRDEAAEKYSPAQRGNSWLAPHMDQTKIDFKAGFDARDEEVKRLRKALERIADPRKLGHTEPDYQTRYYCLIHVAEEALKDDGR